MGVLVERMRYTDHDLLDFDGEFDVASSDLIGSDRGKDDIFGDLGFGCFTEGNVLESRCIISGEHLNSFDKNQTSQLGQFLNFSVYIYLQI